MERLFSPCTRVYDILESQGRLEEFRGRHQLLQELDLDVSTQEFGRAAFTYADLYAMLGNGETVAWLTPHAAVSRDHGRAMHFWKQLDGLCSFCFSADGVFVLARSSEHLLEIVDVVIRLLAVSVVQSVCLSHWRSPEYTFINAPALTYLMDQCQSLKVLSLKNLKMDENHCRVLGAYSRPDLNIVLDGCKMTSAGANALVEVLGRNQGPTKLDRCRIDNLLLANGLRENSRLKSLTTRISDFEVGNRELLAIAGAVKENKGLVDLDLSCRFRASDEMWDAICDSLETHPTLEVLDLCTASMDLAIAPAVLKSRIQALLDMLKVNMSIHTIRLNPLYSQHELFRESVIPYLETNRFRPRLLAIQRTRPITYRSKVLGRALLSARTDANSFWMLLSGNAEVAFPSTTTTTTPAANPPMHATAVATSNVALICCCCFYH
jgi:hypothetical protein